MSRHPSPLTNVNKLDNATPGTREVGLGKIIANLIVQVNALVADNAALSAKLNTAGATVTGLGTNYGAAVTAVAVPTIDTY